MISCAFSVWPACHSGSELASGSCGVGFQVP